MADVSYGWKYARKDEDKEFHLVIIHIPVMCDQKKKKKTQVGHEKPSGVTVAILHNTM